MPPSHTWRRVLWALLAAVVLLISAVLKIKVLASAESRDLVLFASSVETTVLLDIVSATRTTDLRCTRSPPVRSETNKPDC
jgi:hypothetical protein